MSVVRNNNYIVIYYAILLLMLALRTSLSVPHPIIRLGYLAAFYIPLILKYTNLYLPCVITFVTVCTYNYAFGYLPYEMNVYFFITLISFVIVFAINKSRSIKISPVFLVLAYYVFFLNLFDSGEPQDIFYSIATVGFGVIITGNDNVANRSNMLNCFTIISFVLSIIYLLNFDKFLDSYDGTGDFERSGWTDPNYLSCIIGMGVITSLILLMKVPKSIAFKIFYIFTILISIISQVLMASRGGLLCVSVSVIIFILFSKIRFHYKLLTLIALLAFIIFLYSNNYLDLLMHRIEGDSDGGSGRLDIWMLKLQEFISEGNIVDWIFGLGYISAFKLGFGENGFGFHNDYLAIMCGYGVVGLMTFLYLLFIYPFKHIQAQRSVVFSLVIYLALACLTLEPISAGRIPYIAFYALIIIYAKVKE